MKLVAHRGASLERPENSLESLLHAARIGADAVECDVRRTADGQFVIFHDEDLLRLAGLPARVVDLSLEEMRRALECQGRPLLTLDALLCGYGEKAPVLFHVKGKAPDPYLFDALRGAGIPLIVGVESLHVLVAARLFLPPERVLAFMPGPTDASDFAWAGAGILRLWETWLDDFTPEMARSQGAREVWIMSRHGGSMNGSAESLSRFDALGADGALLNDIALGLAWRAGRKGLG